MECLRCKNEMNFLKEAKFDSQDNNRGIFGAIFDVEQHLVFKIYVCQNCGHSEFFYRGSKTHFGD